ncbi:MAG: hypothetical protein NTX82_04285 [Candidatus Parcubacteria bacterium]|nr:hypothetical protein [Candidatus Parcubacteria bacterium]
MINLNDIVTLKAKSKHGKDRLHQHGSIWEVIGLGTFKGAAAVSLQSAGKTFRQGQEMTHDKRWVHLKDDPDFEIMP